MTILWTTLAVLLLLVLFNAVLAASEMAMATARRGRLQARADEGDRGAAAALGLQDNPNRFLSTIQVGITLVGTVAAVYSGDQLDAPLTELYAPWAGEWTKELVFLTVVVGLSFLQLVLGELVPKRLGMQSAETVASTVARPMLVLSLLARPVVAVLSGSTNFALWLLRQHRVPEETVTQDDILHMVRESAEDGEIQEHEEDIIHSVLGLGGKLVRQIRTPRTEVQGVDLAKTLPEQLSALLESGYSRFPAYREDLDHVEGVILAKDLFRASLDGTETVELPALVRHAVFVPENTRALQLLQQMQKERVHIAMVVNEHGIFEGVATLEDLLEEIVGEIEDETDEATDPDIVEVGGGTWLVSGTVPVGRVEEELDLPEISGQDEGLFDTLAGLVLYLMGRIPNTGESVESGGVLYRVVDMDGLRIDKVEVIRLGRKERPASD